MSLREGGRMDKDQSADGLRGIAALNVVVCHFLCAFVPGAMFGNYPAIFAPPGADDRLAHVLANPLLSLLYNGHFPVVVFFVLSGYVLTIPFFRTGETATLKRRLYGRYLRLNLPIACAVMLSFLLYSAGFYANVAAAEQSGSVGWLGKYMAPGLTWSDALGDALYGAVVLGHNVFDTPLWSLRIEFVGSVILLGFFLAFPRRMGVPLAVLAVVLVALFELRALYYLAIFAGAFLNRFRCSRGNAVLLVVLGCYLGAYRYDSAIHAMLPSIEEFVARDHADKVLYNTIGGVAVVAGVLNGFGTRILSSALPQFLGRISYALYLTHFLVLLSVGSWLYLQVGSGTPGLLAVFAAYLAVSVVLAMGFEALVDRPAIAWTRRFVAQAMAGRGTREPQRARA